MYNFNIYNIDFEFPIGTVLKLVHSLNKDTATSGAVAITVDGKKEFPKLYSDLCSKMPQDDIENFIAVVWDKSNINYHGAIDGYYMKQRFDVNEDQSDFRVNLSQIKNNDGRLTCFKCGGSTKLVQGFQSSYNICPKCKI